MGELKTQTKPNTKKVKESLKIASYSNDPFDVDVRAFDVPLVRDGKARGDTYVELLKPAKSEIFLALEHTVRGFHFWDEGDAVTIGANEYLGEEKCLNAACKAMELLQSHGVPIDVKTLEDKEAMSAFFNSLQRRA